MKNVYKCDYCDFESEVAQETQAHEQVCRIKSMLGFLGIDISRDVVEKLQERFLIKLKELVLQHSAAVESVALTKPVAEAKQMWICPKVENCSWLYCGGHNVPHYKNKDCELVGLDCPACVPVEVAP